MSLFNNFGVHSGVNFINILRSTFTPVDHESVKVQLSHQCLFTLLGATSVKAVRRTLMKLSPDIMGEGKSLSLLETEVRYAKMSSFNLFAKILVRF